MSTTRSPAMSLSIARERTHTSTFPAFRASSANASRAVIASGVRRSRGDRLSVPAAGHRDILFRGTNSPRYH